MSGKHERACQYSNYVEHLSIIASTVTSRVSISAFASLFCVPVGMSPEARFKKCVKLLQELKRINQLSRIIME